VQFQGKSQCHEGNGIPTPKATSKSLITVVFWHASGITKLQVFLLIRAIEMGSKRDRLSTFANKVGMAYRPAIEIN